MLTPESITGGDRKLVGSMLLIEATTLEEVEAKVKQDVYWTNDVVSLFTGNLGELLTLGHSVLVG